MQLVKEMLGGEYEFVLTTHINKGYICNHLAFNAVSLADYHHYHSSRRSYHYIRRVSDRLCGKYGLSVIIPGQNRGKSCAGYTAEETGIDYKARLETAIGRLIPVSSDFEDLIRRLQNEEREIKRGKYISCRAFGQERFTRTKTLSADCTEEAVATRAAGRPCPSRRSERDNGRVNLLIDIQNSIKAQGSVGSAHRVEINNLKQAAKTMNFLAEHGISSYEELEEKADTVALASDKLFAPIKTTESRMADLTLLVRHAAASRKLRPAYGDYQKSSDKEKSLRGYEGNIILFEVSTRVLEEMKIEKLPSAGEMKAEYDILADKKGKLYGGYKFARQESKEYSVIEQNMDSLLMLPKEQDREKYTER